MKLFKSQQKCSMSNSMTAMHMHHNYKTLRPNLY
uniref:Uncharacterized protein n=1 Tax=Rhizophora mucronata TaxID=61149 RepID=A0A2P2Q6L9_RHIMU